MESFDSEISATNRLKEVVKFVGVILVHVSPSKERIIGPSDSSSPKTAIMSPLLVMVKSVYRSSPFPKIAFHVVPSSSLL